MENQQPREISVKELSDEILTEMEPLNQFERVQITNYIQTAYTTLEQKGGSLDIECLRYLVGSLRQTGFFQPPNIQLKTSETHLSGWNLFQQDHKSKNQAEVAKLWHDLSEAEKKIYKDRAIVHNAPLGKKTSRSRKGITNGWILYTKKAKQDNKGWDYQTIKSEYGKLTADQKKVYSEQAQALNKKVKQVIAN